MTDGLLRICSESFVDFGLSLAADRLRNIAEDVKAFTLEIVFDVTQRAQRGTSQGTAVVEPFQELVLHILYLNGGDPLPVYAPTVPE